MVTLEVIEERVNNTYKLLEKIAEDNKQSHKEITENFNRKYSEIQNSYDKLTTHVNHRNDTICKDLTFLNTELLKISQEVIGININRNKINDVEEEVENKINNIEKEIKSIRDKDLTERSKNIGRKELVRWISGFFGLGIGLFTLLELLKTFILGCI